ncbi:1-deoxy-D-xylulose-5-phosphate reductoisomerase [uncultured Litoreibacter sp.]|uniref:1-deoxy-D-xylulose-5-phosphate reductoisomerase n=1 Tax=uncultured Litoreibacter sp. TaxID=1392394 RepID=UPI0026215BD0|nr:1-deoxy-D-xylulose-5-phosphate reductoisomerase [uncultured Litoreibacter sp.]
MRKVTIFGSTGSIGENTVDLISRDPSAYDVVALTGGRNVARLAEQAVALNADLAVTAFEDCFEELKALLAGTGVDVAAGASAVNEAAERPADWVMSAIVGAAGLMPGMKALEQGKTLALANKESLVTAGPILLGHAQTHNATVLPVDSEHSAVFQALVGEDIKSVERIIITASGGAFRDWDPKDLHKATLEDACTHPNWDMGQRITIDSASLFNKAMELIETKEFFGVRPDQIEAVVHPESLVHALVGFNDGALMAHLGAPDMRHAIGYALHWPDRAHIDVARLDLTQIATLNFRTADPDRYPALRLAREVMEAGGLAGAVFTAAKDAALDAFIARQIGFTDMAEVVDATLSTLSGEIAASGQLSLDSVLAADHLARKTAQNIIAAR